MVVYGMATTIPITMEEMLLLVKAVSRANNNSLIVADMPFMSYQPSVEDAVRNAGRFIKESGAGAVKLEGGNCYKNQIQGIINAGIPVVGHIGLLPQSYHLSSGYRIQGKTKLEANKILDDAFAVEESGVFAVVLEGLPSELAKQITEKLRIPTIGIGAGPYCDGQIQVFHDIMGLNEGKIPKHSKSYGNLGEQIEKILFKYKEDVEKNKFPNKSNYIESAEINIKD